MKRSMHLDHQETKAAMAEDRVNIQYMRTKLNLSSSLVLALAMLATPSPAQCFVGIHHQVWDTGNMTPYFDAFTDQQTHTLRISTIEVTTGFLGETPNNWIIDRKRSTLNAILAQRQGTSVWWVGRFDRTRGQLWQTVPTQGLEQDWWASWTAKRAANVDMVAVWNEPSLGWTPQLDADRPIRHAALTVKLLDQMGPTSRVLGPSVHAISDNPAIGMGYTYIKQFFDALPERYRSRVMPDAHMYYGYGEGAFVDQKAEMAAYLALMATYGYKPADLWFTEVGSEYKQPSSLTAATTLRRLVAGLRSFGVPAQHIGLWQWETGVMRSFNADGSLTAYGQAVHDLLQTPGAK